MCKKLHLKKKILLWVVVFFACFSAFAQTTPYNVVMNIYDDPTTKMAFNWFTGSGVTGGQVRVMRGGNIVKTVPAACTQYPGYTENKAVVTGLEPNTTYSFLVGKAGAWSSTGTFTTAKANKEPFSFIYVTDTQVSGNDRMTLQTNSQAAFTKYPNANFWLHCGDLTHGDSVLSKHIGLMSEFFEKQQDYFYDYPFAPIQGNHDRPGNDAIFKSHFNLNSTLFDTHGSTYTYIYGDAQFFAINSELNYNTAYINALYDWMRDSINAHSDITWRIVYFHKNIYSSSYGVQRETACRNWFNVMTPLFDSLNIDIALQGHSHIYEVIGPVFDTTLVQGSVTNVKSVPKELPYKNVTGKSGGFFNVSEGTLYFTNGAFGNALTDFIPCPILPVSDGKFTDITHYADLFTGRWGQIGKPTYSHVSVSTESIVITTYEIDNGNSQLLDKITIVKECTDEVISGVTYDENTTITSCRDIYIGNVTVTDNAKLTLGEGASVIFTDDLDLDSGTELEIK